MELLPWLTDQADIGAGPTFSSKGFPNNCRHPLITRGQQHHVRFREELLRLLQLSLSRDPLRQVHIGWESSRPMYPGAARAVYCSNGDLSTLRLADLHISHQGHVDRRLFNTCADSRKASQKPSFSLLNHHLSEFIKNSCPNTSISWLTILSTAVRGTLHLQQQLGMYWASRERTASVGLIAARHSLVKSSFV